MRILEVLVLLSCLLNASHESLSDEASDQNPSLPGISADLKTNANKTEKTTEIKDPSTKGNSSQGNVYWDETCQAEQFSRMSCTKVFCPPWRRCIAGKCACKMPYKCERLPDQRQACTLEGLPSNSMCLSNANACKTDKAIFSHFNSTCSGEHKVEAFIKEQDNNKVVEIQTTYGRKLICGNEWSMAAANVICRNPLRFKEGAKTAQKIVYEKLTKTDDLPDECVKVRCTGAELSVAECTIFNPQKIESGAKVAGITCYEKKDEDEDFPCVNGKHVRSGRLCDGVDDCGDNSDEMCCLKCNPRSNAFHCQSGVCIPHYAVNDGIRDCLGGEDESEITDNQTDDSKTSKKEETASEKKFYTDPQWEIRKMRSHTESKLECGIPNMNYTYRPEERNLHQRRKRLVGGEEALPTQIQWQVAIQDEGLIHCGGVFLGGCWVLTAAHCVRPHPKSFRVKFSLWEKHRQQSTTDSIPVKTIYIHPQYNSQTYANDIALVLLEELKLKNTCMLENPAVRSVCVPWSTLQFPPNHVCTISGWGRDREGKSASILKWANVTLIDNCEIYYKDRFLPGMQCAGDLEGKVDSCQGDSGGPLVCKDASGLSYVWGIVSWGDKCGEPGFPGVYTKVAHYFDWIRSVTGNPAVAKFNQ